MKAKGRRVSFPFPGDDHGGFRKVPRPRLYSWQRRPSKYDDPNQPNQPELPPLKMPLQEVLADSVAIARWCGFDAWPAVTWSHAQRLQAVAAEVMAPPRAPESQNGASGSTTRLKGNGANPHPKKKAPHQAAATPPTNGPGPSAAGVD